MRCLQGLRILITAGLVAAAMSRGGSRTASDMTATSARWEQASSADGGNTWETNWILEFQRVGS